MLKETGEAKGRKKNLPEHMQIELWEDISLDYVPRLSYLTGGIVVIGTLTQLKFLKYLRKDSTMI